MFWLNEIDENLLSKYADAIVKEFFSVLQYKNILKYHWYGNFELIINFDEDNMDY